MTDNEIIKALECCKYDDCNNCPNVCDNRHANLIDCVLDLINRKNKEISDLKIELQAMRNAANSYKAEVERLTAMVEAAEDYLHPLPFKNAFDDQLAKSKSEAIKEFAERLKEKSSKWGYDKVVYVDDIETLLKEMVSE